MYQIWRIYLDLWGHDCKKWVWPTFGCKLGQNDPIVMQLKLDMSCHLLNVYTKFQIDISKHVEEKSGKRGRTDGQTDGRTLPRHNTSRFSNGRIKNCMGNKGYGAHSIMGVNLLVWWWIIKQWLIGSLTNYCHFPNDNFNNIFSNKDILIWIIISLKFASNEQYSKIGSDNGLAPATKTAIVSDTKFAN